MLRQLLQDMNVLHQQGAGYYSCIPIIDRYNKLLGQAKTIFDSDDSLMNTFEDQEESDPKDPADKMKIVQAIRIEAGQLISLLDSSQPDKEEGAA
jgi:hypothetical protein